MKRYRANQYDMLKKNCNHFTNELLIMLLGRGLPPYLNRIAYLGSFLHCLVPRKYLTVTPDMSDAEVVLDSGLDPNSTVASSKDEEDYSIEEGSSEEDESFIINDPSQGGSIHFKNSKKR